MIIGASHEVVIAGVVKCLVELIMEASKCVVTLMMHLAAIYRIPLVCAACNHNVIAADVLGTFILSLRAVTGKICVAFYNVIVSRDVIDMIFLLRLVILLSQGMLR